MNTVSSIGVVIPAFNEAHNLSRVLVKSCATPWLAQIVVVDDGSSDNILAIAQQYARRDGCLMALQLPQNKGKAGAMLAGGRVLQTEFVIFLDADLGECGPIPGVSLPRGCSRNLRDRHRCVVDNF